MKIDVEGDNGMMLELIISILANIYRKAIGEKILEKQWLAGRANLIVEKYLEKFFLDSKKTLVYAWGHPRMIEGIKQRLRSKEYKVKEERFWRE